MGTTLAPDLRHSVGPDGSVTHDVFIQKVTDGVPDKGMPAWKGTLSPEQVEDIWAYVKARSSGRLAPGRPHLASGREARLRVVAASLTAVRRKPRRSSCARRSRRSGDRL